LNAIIDILGNGRASSGILAIPVHNVIPLRGGREVPNLKTLDDVVKPQIGDYVI
jgi:hypothetical protein